MRAVVSALALLLASAFAAEAQDVARTCDSYAKDAVSLNQQNIDARCGLSGPEWNSNYRYHYDWCVNGQNYRSADGWTKWRRDRITQCQTAKPPAPPTPQAPSASIAKVCESYAAKAVSQQQVNAQMSCGFSGPQWNATYKYHYDWCISGNNSQSASAGDAWREARLGECRTAKAPAQPAPPALTPGAPSQVQRPLATQSAWAARIPQITNAILARLDAGMDRIRAQVDQSRAKWLKAKPLDVQAIIAAARPLTLAEKYAALERAQRSLIAAAKPAPRDLHLPPKVTSIVTSPVAGKVEPGSALLIAGSNFGNEPGKVYLVYVTRRETSGTEARPEAVKEERVELQPFRSSWAESWYGNLILAKAAKTYLDPDLRADRPGEILVVLPDGAQAKTAVTVSGGFPEIKSIETARGDRHVKPGDTFVLRGRNFGDRPGAIRFQLSQAPPKRWWRIRNTDHFVYWEDKGGAATPVGTAGDVALKVLDPWTDTAVSVMAGASPLKPYESAIAFTDLTTADGRRGLAPTVNFGPDLEFKKVSGIDWLDRSARNAAKVTQKGGALLATHVPSCGAFTDSNEKGVDMFFHEVPWPQDVEIYAFDFKQIQPSDRYDDLDFFIDQMSDIVNAVASGPFGVATYILGKALDAIFGGAGGYHAYVAAWPLNSQVVSIGWETACALDGKPIMYVISFSIMGTKEALAKYR